MLPFIENLFDCNVDSFQIWPSHKYQDINFGTSSYILCKKGGLDTAFAKSLSNLNTRGLTHLDSW